jgi:hypothetical protein
MTLRDQLRDALPRIPLKAAWRELIRHNRKRKADGPRILKQADVERALSAEPPDGFDPNALKAALAATDGAEVDRLLGWLVQIATDPVDVSISGWPDSFGEDLQARLLRRPLGSMSPGEAAAVRKEFDWFDLGGHVLRVKIDLPPNHALPGVPRHLRVQPQRRDRGWPWLPNVDNLGRRYLTPKPLAERQATCVAALGDSVLDGFCGVGGNAVMFARAGLKVTAVENDLHRLNLARRNADALELDIDFIHGDLRDHLDVDADVLFLDPPWNRESDAPTWPTLLDFVPVDRPNLVLKLPRTFELRTLPPRDWTVHWEFGAAEDDHNIVRMLTAVSP